MPFYEYCQNNSGGSFVTDDKLCHRLFIEADNLDEADNIAESLGCYFNGVEEDLDCPCCGDRWYRGHEVKLNPMSVSKYGKFSFDKKKDDEKEIEQKAEAEWKKCYGKFDVVKEPKWERKKGSTPLFVGTIQFKGIEEYAQFMSDEFGWTKPDARIFYKNKNKKVKEIFSKKIKK